MLVHADGGSCHGTPLDKTGKCPECGITPDMQSTELWPVDTDKPETFTEIKDEFESALGKGIPEMRALSIGLMQTLELLALREVLNETLDASILIAVEFGYRCCEKGMNLQAALIEAKAKLECP